MTVTLDPETRTWGDEDGHPVRLVWHLHPGTLAVVILVGDAFWHLSAIGRTPAGGVEVHLITDPAPVAAESLIPFAAFI